MDQWISIFSDLLNASKANLLPSLICIGVLWGIHVLNILTRMRLNVFGILPRTQWGLVGIFTSPFLHGNFEHLFFNSIPLFILIDFLLINGVSTFITITLIIMIISGLLVWLLGRRAFHIGASGVMMGYWTFLLINAFATHSPTSWILGALCLYYLGGMFVNLFPRDPGTSFEAHIFGAIAGAIAAYALLYQWI
jgi:membrane associated rhomboid family serine protease